MVTIAGVATFAGCNLTGTDGTYTLHAHDGITSVTVTVGTSSSAPARPTRLAFTNSTFGVAANATVFTPQPDSHRAKTPAATPSRPPDSITLSVNEARRRPATAPTNPVATDVRHRDVRRLQPHRRRRHVHIARRPTGPCPPNSDNIALGYRSGKPPRVHEQRLHAGRERRPAGTPARGDRRRRRWQHRHDLRRRSRCRSLAVPPSSTARPTRWSDPSSGSRASRVATSPDLPRPTRCTRRTERSPGTARRRPRRLRCRDHLAFTNTAFGDAVNGAAFSPQPEVTVRDAADNIVHDRDLDHLDLERRHRRPSSAPTTAVNTTAGVSTFTGCDLVGPDGTYTLHATDGSVTGDSGNVVLGGGPATSWPSRNSGFGAGRQRGGLRTAAGGHGARRG